MKTKCFALIVCFFAVSSLFAQAKRDTIYIYDTVRISVKRPPAPPPQDFFEVETATFLQDSIIIGEQTKQSSTMNNLKKSANKLIRRLSVGTMAVISSLSSSFAQTNPDTVQNALSEPVVVDTIHAQIVEYDSATTPQKRSPIYFGFVYPIGIHGTESENYVYNLAFSALTGAVGGIEGIQMAGLYNQVNGAMTGMQCAGLMNISESVGGVQMAGISNFTKDVKGGQWAGILNQSGDVLGIQHAGIMNVADKVEGMQSAGIYNVADTLTGVQAAGIANEVKNVEGAQIAGIYNRAERVKGIQFGFYNETKVLSGVQIGLINKVDTIQRGISIGLLNFIKNNRFQELEFIHTNYQSMLLGYRIGGSLLHCLMGIGGNYNLQTANVELRLGIGNRVRLVQNLHLQTSLFASNMAFWGKNYTNKKRRNVFWDHWTTVSCGLAYYWGDKIGIKVIPNIRYWRNETPSQSRIKPDNLLSYEVGIDLGISIKF